MDSTEKCELMLGLRYDIKRLLDKISKKYKLTFITEVYDDLGYQALWHYNDLAANVIVRHVGDKYIQIIGPDYIYEDIRNELLYNRNDIYYISNTGSNLVFYVEDPEKIIDPLSK